MGVDITVLMPVYNASRYLEASINSILDQTFGNFELLIIDDASTDNSVAIIRSFTDPRIRLVLNEVNLGITPTLNLGISLASAELIARMDADDICYQERLALQFEFMQKNALTILLSTSVRVISEEGRELYIHDFDRRYNAYNLNFICPVYHPTVMFRRSIVLKLGGYRIPYAEDLDLWWRLARMYKIDHLSTVLLDYRVAGESLSNATKKKEYDDAQHELLLEHIKFYTGDALDLSYEEAECLRHEFSSMLEKKDVGAIVNCLDKLDIINQAIANTPNLNYTASDVLIYAQQKKEYILYYFYLRLPRLKAIWLLLRTKSLLFVFKRVQRSLAR